MAFLKPNMSAGEKVAWKVLSFFSLPYVDQLQQVWNPGPIFYPEKANKNPGANFLIGLAALYIDFGYQLLGQAEGPEEKSLGELKEQISSAHINYSSPVWSLSALHADPFWETVREKANEAIALLSLHQNDFDTEVKFEDYVEIERYRQDQ